MRVLAPGASVVTVDDATYLPFVKKGACLFGRKQRGKVDTNPPRWRTCTAIIVEARRREDDVLKLVFDGSADGLSKATAQEVSLESFTMSKECTRDGVWWIRESTRSRPITLCVEKRPNVGTRELDASVFDRLKKRYRGEAESLEDVPPPPALALDVEIPAPAEPPPESPVPEAPPTPADARPFPLHGVRVSYLRKWLQDNDVPAAATTAELWERHLKPATVEEGVSFAELVHSKLSPGDFSEQATVFCSHAWSYNAYATLDALVARGYADDYVWMDQTSVNQHDQRGKSSQWFSDVFHAAIKSIGRVALVLQPWDAPTSLRRVWCLWEIYGAVTLDGVAMDVLLSDDDEDAFALALLTKFDNILDGPLSKIDVEKAQASYPNDREMIFQAMQNAGGPVVVENAVLDALRKWFLKTAESRLKRIETEGYVFGAGAENEDAFVHTLPPVADGVDAPPADRKAAFLCNQIAKLNAMLGNVRPAVEAQKRALEYDARLYGDNSLSVARDLNNLGHLAVEAHEDDLEINALPMLQRALTIRKANLSEDAYAIGRTVFNIGAVLHKVGKYDEAELYYVESERVLMKKWAVADGEKLPSGHPDVAMCRMAVGAVHRERGDFIAARDCISAALNDMEERYRYLNGLRDDDPVDSPDVADGYVALAEMATLLGDAKEADAALDVAHDVVRRAYGENSIPFSHVLNVRARSLAAQLKFTSAMEYQRKAASIVERIAVRDRKQESGERLAKLYLGLGYLLLEEGKDLKAAFEVSERALKLRIKVMGTEDHTAVARAKTNVAAVQIARGRPDEAVLLCDAALATVKAVSSTHADLTEISHVRGNALYAKGEYQACIAQYREAAERAVSKQQRWQIQSSLGKALTDVGELNEAETLLTQCLSDALEIYGKQTNGAVAESNNNLARYYVETGDFEIALKHQETALAIDLQLYDVESVAVARDKSNLGYLALIRRPFSLVRLEKKAIPLLKQAYEFRLALYGSENHGAVSRTLSNVGTALYLAGRVEEAEDAYRRTIGALLQTNEAHAGRMMAALARLLVVRSMAPIDDAVSHAFHKSTVAGELELSEAESLLKDALALFTKRLGEDVVVVHATKIAIADVERRRGQLDAAEAVTAIEGPLKRLTEQSKDQGDLVVPLTQYGHALFEVEVKDREAGNDSARALSEAKRVAEEVLGPEHPDSLLI